MLRAWVWGIYTLTHASWGEVERQGRREQEGEVAVKVREIHC
jgi:hypothetical protein